MTAKTDASFTTKRRANGDNGIPYLSTAIAIFSVAGLAAIFTSVNKWPINTSLFGATYAALGFAFATAVIGNSGTYRQKKLRKSYGYFIGALRQHGVVKIYDKELYGGTNIVATYHLTGNPNARIDATLADNGILIECYCNEALGAATKAAQRIYSMGVPPRHIHIELREPSLMQTASETEPS